MSGGGGGLHLSNILLGCRASLVGGVSSGVGHWGGRMLREDPLLPLNDHDWTRCEMGASGIWGTSSVLCTVSFCIDVLFLQWLCQ